jgi:hypothetical protein
MDHRENYERDLAHEVVFRLIDDLKEIPEVRPSTPSWEIAAPEISRGIDATLGVDVAGKKYLLLIEVKKSIFPRDVPQLLWKLHHFERRQSNAIPLVAAESISSGAKDLLKKEHVGYYDTGGSLFIPGRGSYVYIEKPPPEALEKPIRNLFRGKRSQILLALLTHREQWFGVLELSALAKVSPATASETLSALDRFDWLSSRGQGPSKERRLIQPAALLDEWRKQILAASRPPAYRRYFVSSGNTENLVERLAELCRERHVQYAITEEAAAQYYAAYLTHVSQVSCRMRSGKAANDVVAALQARIVIEGANLNVIETREEGDFLFTQSKRDICLASPVQVYLDLLRKPGRAKEQAEHLRQEIIGF